MDQECLVTFTYLGLASRTAVRGVGPPVFARLRSLSRAARPAQVGLDAEVPPTSTPRAPSRRRRARPRMDFVEYKSAFMAVFYSTGVLSRLGTV